MTKLHKTLTSLLLTAVLLLSGCSKQEPASVSNSDTNISSDIPDSTSPQSTDFSDSTTTEPESSAYSENSESSSSESRELIIPTEFTEEDRELQKILKELWPAVFDINLMFRGSSAINESIIVKYSDYKSYYCLIPENMKSPNGIFTVPQTYDEMEELLLKYHTERSAEKYMREVNRGELTENPDGTYNLTVYDTDKGRTPFIETDGRMYCNIGVIGGAHGLDCDTAKVIEKTDDLIHFSCVIYLGELDYKNENGLAWNADGFLKYERGGWKLNYHRDTRFAME